MANFIPKTGCANRGGGGKVRRLTDSMHPNAYRITDPEVLAILTDMAHFRAVAAWAVPTDLDGEAQYGAGE